MDILPYKIYYENSAGVIIRLDEPPLVALGGELFNSGWKMTTASRPGRDGGRLIARKRQSGEKKLRIAAMADSPRELSAAIEAASEALAYDSSAMQPGRLWVNGWYLSCYCLAEARELSPDHTHMAELTLTLLAETPLWCREEAFTKTGSEATDSTEHKYLYKYPYRYGADSEGLQILNRTGMPQPMRITFFGPCSNPSVILADFETGIGTSIAQNERAVIDQQTREIYKISADGERMNLFGRRLKNGQVFTFAPPGSNIAHISGAEKASVTIITQKGAPPWSI